MLEMVFVILILGIVASIGSEIIARVYSNYIVERAQYRASIKTELAALQIANRLRYAIPGTVVRRIGTGGTAEELSTPLGGNADAYTVLQWVAYDGDSFEAFDPAASTTTRLPGWSGFVDLNASTRDTIITPGSSVGFADKIIQNLSKNTTGASLKGIGDAVIYFPYDTNAYGVDGTASGGSTLKLDANISGVGVGLVEQYKLAWASYALVVEGTTNDLYLYYNFSPTPGAAIANAQKSLLLKNITNFKFQGSGRTIRFKICKEEPIAGDLNISACKEKAVF